YSGASTGKTIGRFPSAQDSVAVVDPSNGFLPTAVGNYQIDYSVTSDSTDEIPSNNQYPSYRFKVGGDLYAVDTAQNVLGGGAPPSGSGIYSATPSSISINNNPPQNYYYATAFTINNADTIRAIDFMFG